MLKYPRLDSSKMIRCGPAMHLRTALRFRGRCDSGTTVTASGQSGRAPARRTDVHVTQLPRTIPSLVRPPPSPVTSASRFCTARDVAVSVAAYRPSITALGVAPPPEGTSFRGAMERDSSIGYEMVQGALVHWSEVISSPRPPPTAVLVHGILGSRKNMYSIARRLVQAFPSWQILLLDLRCHGESAWHPRRPSGPHSVDSAAGDVLQLLGRLKLFPELLIGHSFGGKVVMSMADQFGRRGSRLPRPVKVWVLDTLPGNIRAGDVGRKDHPADLIAALQLLQLPINDRKSVNTYLEERGFSEHIAKWVSTNLRPMVEGRRELVWSFDLNGIAQMYESYESTSLWSFLRQPQDGIEVNFVRAEHSSFRWGGDDEAAIRAAGHEVHLLRHAGHWVHTDNPEGLLQLLAPSFGASQAVATI